MEDKVTGAITVFVPGTGRSIDIGALADSAFARAKRILKRDHKLTPTVFIITPTGDTVMRTIPGWADAHDKRLKYGAISFSAGLLDAVAVIAINEMWVAYKQDSPELLESIREGTSNYAPSCDPERKEALMMNVLGKDFTSYGIIQSFKHVGAALVFEEDIMDSRTIPGMMFENYLIPPWWENKPRSAAS